MRDASRGAIEVGDEEDRKKADEELKKEMGNTHLSLLRENGCSYEVNEQHDLHLINIL